MVIFADVWLFFSFLAEFDFPNIIYCSSTLSLFNIDSILELSGAVSRKMLSKDHEADMLKEIDCREILSNTQDSTQERVNAIIRIAAEQLKDSLDEAECKNFGTLTDYSYEQNVQEITKVTNKVLQETLGIQVTSDKMRLAIVKEWVKSEKLNNNQNDE